MNLSNHPLFLSLTPVFILIGVGYLAGRREWISSAAIKDLSNLVFLVLIPALLFRTMSGVQLHELDLTPIAAYFLAVGLVFVASILWRGFNCESVVLALAGTFSNMVMIGITLVGLAYGQQGLVTLLTLVSVHALILLTAGSIILELAAARDQRSQAGTAPHVWKTAASAIKGSLIHPIPLPIVFGLLFAQTGWALPAVVDKPLSMLAAAFGPIALVLVGVSLAKTPMQGFWRTAAVIAISKNLIVPAAVACSAWLMGIRGLPLVVMIVAAGLPTGANVFLFAQRYKVVQELTTASMGVSTVLAAITLSIIMLLVSLIPI